MNDLAISQRRLWHLLTAPSGVRAALAEAGDPEGRGLEGWVRSDGRLPATLRLEIYANAYFARIHEALAEDFAALCAAVGSAGFHDLVTAYLCVHPPERPSLRHAGERLAGFLAAQPAAEPFRRRWPFAADLARLEWALADAFDAQDAEPLGRDALAGLPPERWHELVLRLHPSVVLVPVGWPVAPMRERYETARAGEPIPAPPEAEPCVIRVWRRRERVRFLATEPEEAELLAGVREGLAFGSLCERLAGRHGAEAAPGRAAAWLTTWIEAELLAR